MKALTVLLLLNTNAGPPATAAPPPSPAVASGPWRVVAEYPLPPALRGAIRVRWAGTAAALIASPRAGLMEVSWGPEGLSSTPVPPPAVGRPRMSYFFGRSGEWTALGSPLGELVFWHSSGSSGGRVSFAVIEALDVGEGRVAVLGIREEERGSPAAEGAVGWVGSLQSSLADLRPVYYSQDGPGAARMVACNQLGLGKVRFLPDGSLLLVPGAEPNAFWYSGTGQLRRVVELEVLGPAIDCRLSAEQADKLGGDPHARWSWFNRHILVDGILPLPGGPALVLRRHREGVTSWELAHVGADGTLRVEPLPLAASSPWTHLDGDVQGERVVALLSEAGPPTGPPVAPPRLVLLERRP